MEKLIHELGIAVKTATGVDEIDLTAFSAALKEYINVRIREEVAAELEACALHAKGMSMHDVSCVLRRRNF